MAFDPSELVKRQAMTPPNAADGLRGHGDESVNVFADSDAMSRLHYVAEGPAAGSKRTSPLHPQVGREAGRPVVIGHKAQRSGR